MVYEKENQILKNSGCGDCAIPDNANGVWIAKFAEMIALMKYSTTNNVGGKIFKQLKALDLNDADIKWEFIFAKFADIIASMKPLMDRSNTVGQKIFWQLNHLIFINQKEKLNYIVKFADMIVSMKSPSFQKSSYNANDNGYTIFETLIELDLANENQRKKWDYIAKFADMIASMRDSNNNIIGEKILMILTIDLANENQRKKWDYIAKFADMIASMKASYDQYSNNNIGYIILLSVQSPNQKWDYIAKFADMIASMKSSYDKISNSNNPIGNNILNKLTALDLANENERNKWDSALECYKENKNYKICLGNLY